MTVFELLFTCLTYIICDGVLGFVRADPTQIIAHAHWSQSGLGSITIVIDCNRLQLERNRNCNRNQIFQIVA